MRLGLGRVMLRAAAAASVVVLVGAQVPLRNPGQPGQPGPRGPRPGANPGSAPPAAPVAQPPVGGTITEVRIEGTQRIDPDTVRSYLLVQPGDPFDADKIDQSLKALFATGLFADVTIQRQGSAMVVHVVENPIINRIAFEGNHKLNDDQLLAEVQLKPRTVFTRTRVQADVKRILDLYRRNARFAARVDPKIIKLEQNRVDLVFEINEGPTTGVKSINFVGTRAFTPSKLKDVIQTRESRWYRFFSANDVYDPDRLTYDRELLRKFYLSQGFADFRVVSAVAELAPSRDGFYITFTVEEGQRYKFGKINIVNQLKEVKTEDLFPVITTHQGEQYNADQVDDSITKLTDALGNRGFAFVDIEPQVTRHADTRTIDVTYNVKEGPRVYVERINITGNVRTLDKVIRREFRLVEGDAFNAAKLRLSQQRIQNLGFFKKVDVTNTPGSSPDKAVINVNVEEQSTGEFSVGVGFDTQDGPLADISIRERNLLGRGQDLRLAFTLAQNVQELDFSYTEPYFLDRNLAAGIDLFALTRNDQTIAQYSQTSIGGSLRVGYQFNDYLRQTLKYTLRNDRIFDVQPTASFFIQEEAGKRTTSAIGQVLIYDRRDNRNDPTSGYFIQLATDLAGFGGDVRYIRNVVSGGIFHPFAPQWVLSLTGEAGDIHGINDTVQIEDRFFVGGDNLRGFQTAGIGPRDVSTGDALGGNDYYVGSVTLGFPMGLPQELGLTGRVFTDFGSLWNVDASGPTVVDNRALRISTGVGVSWTSPLGPIRFDIGVPVKKESFDKKELFRVNFGTRF